MRGHLRVQGRGCGLPSVWVQPAWRWFTGGCSIRRCLAAVFRAVQGRGVVSPVCDVGADCELLLCASARAAVVLVLRCLCRGHAHAAAEVRERCAPPPCPMASWLGLRPVGARPILAMAASAEGTSTGSCSESGASPLRGPDRTNLSAAAEFCGIDHDAIESLKTKTLADSILALREEQIRVRTDRKRVAKELKNA